MSADLIPAANGSAIRKGRFVLTGDASEPRIARVDSILVFGEPILRFSLRLTWFEPDGREIAGFADYRCVLAAAHTRNEIEVEREILIGVREVPGNVVTLQPRVLTEAAPD